MKDTVPSKDTPESEASPAPNRDWIFFVVLAVFIVLAIAGMMVFDQWGESRMGDGSHVQDAADR